jgi:plastocyanin
MKIVRSILIVVVIAIVVYAGLSALTWPKANGNSVTMQFLSFHPGTLTVAAGSTVTWTDKDPFTKHDVIGTGFASPNMTMGSNYSYVFATPGIYTYTCSHHRWWMKGTIIVK